MLKLVASFFALIGFLGLGVAPAAADDSSAHATTSAAHGGSTAKGSVEL